MQFGEILKQIRAEKELSQIELAKLCNLTPSCIAMLETNRNEPSGNTIRALSKGLNISSDYLLGLENDIGAKTYYETEITKQLNNEEKEIINNYRSLTPPLKKMIRETLKTFTRSEDNKNLKDKSN